jgi:hypothetical protein
LAETISLDQVAVFKVHGKKMMADESGMHAVHFCMPRRSATQRPDSCSPVSKHSRLKNGLGSNSLARAHIPITNPEVRDLGTRALGVPFAPPRNVQVAS